MARLRDAWIAGVLCGLAVAQGEPAAAPRTAAELLQSADCQTALPGEPDARGDSAPSRRLGGRSMPQEPRKRWQGIDLGIAEGLLWFAVVATVVALLVAIVRARFGGGAPARGEPATDRGRLRAAAAAPALVPDVVADHERLAAAGDYRGAVHALLRRALDAWNERGAALPLHATAREALRRARRVLAAEPLAQLVGVVEHVRFGGRSADRELYESSRAQLVAWEAACRQSR